MLSFLRDHYGNIASVLGLMFTIVTMFKAQGAKKAAEEASNAAREAFSRIKSRLLATEIENALQLVRKVDSLCREKKWEETLANCDEVRAELARIKEHDKLHDEEKEALEIVVRQTGEILMYVQKIKDSKPDRSVSQKTFNDLHKMIALLGKIQGRLHSQIIEIP